jgi:hypothetical protein
MSDVLAKEIERIAEKYHDDAVRAGLSSYGWSPMSVRAALSELAEFVIKQAAERMCPYCADAKKLIFEAPSCYYHDLSRWVGLHDGTDAFVKCYEICKSAAILVMTDRSE